MRQPTCSLTFPGWRQRRPFHACTTTPLLIRWQNPSSIEHLERPLVIHVFDHGRYVRLTSYNSRRAFQPLSFFINGGVQRRFCFCFESSSSSYSTPRPWCTETWRGIEGF